MARGSGAAFGAEAAAAAEAEEPQEVPYNAEPVRFSNELWEGRVLVVVRPAREIPAQGWLYEPLFRGKRRRLEVQVQGRFKRPPKHEELWVRASPLPLERMTLSVVAHSFCRVVLVVMRNLLGRGFRHSFGDDGDSPHMSFPIHQICSVVRTPPGKEVPRLGSQTLQALQTGSAGWRGLLPLDSEHTYTFTWHTMYLDLDKWQLVRIPGLQAMPLETFWGDADSLQVAMYSENSRRVYWDLRLSRGAGGASITGGGELPGGFEDWEECRSQVSVRTVQSWATCISDDMMSVASIESEEDLDLRPQPGPRNRGTRGQRGILLFAPIALKCAMLRMFRSMVPRRKPAAPLMGTPMSRQSTPSEPPRRRRRGFVAIMFFGLAIPWLLRPTLRDSTMWRQPSTAAVLPLAGRRRAHPGHGASSQRPGLAEALQQVPERYQWRWRQRRRQLLDPCDRL